MKKLLRVFIPVIILLSVTLSGCNYLLPKPVERRQPPLVKPTEVVFDTFTVKKGDIDDCVKGGVKIDSSEEADYEFLNYGTQKVINVKLGDVVEKGDLLAVQFSNLPDNSEYQAELDNYADLLMQYKDTPTDDTDTRKEIEDLMKKSEKKLIEMNPQVDELGNVISEENPLNKVYAIYDGTVTYLLDATESKHTRGVNIKIISTLNYEKFYMSYIGSNEDRLTDNMKVVLTTKEGETFDAYIKKNIIENEEITIIKLAVSEKKKIKFGDVLSLYVSFDTRKDVVIIPKNLVKNYQGRDYVEVLTPDGKKIERILELGLADSTNREVLKGLDVGDKIIIR